MSLKENKMFVNDELKGLDMEIEMRKEGLFKYVSTPELVSPSNHSSVVTGYSVPLKYTITHCQRRNNTTNSVIMRSYYPRTCWVLS